MIGAGVCQVPCRFPLPMRRQNEQSPNPPAQILMLVVMSDFFDAGCGIDGLGSKGLELWKRMLLVGLGVGGCQGFSTLCLEMAKHRQIAKWKKEYLKSILRQDVGWYDVNRPQELSTRMGDAMVQIEKARFPASGRSCVLRPKHCPLALVAATASGRDLRAVRLHLREDGSCRPADPSANLAVKCSPQALQGSNGNIFTGAGALPSGLLLAFTNSVPIAAVTAGVAGLTYLPSILVLLRLLDQRTKVRR